MPTGALMKVNEKRLLMKNDLRARRWRRAASYAAVIALTSTAVACSSDGGVSGSSGDWVADLEPMTLTVHVSGPESAANGRGWTVFQEAVTEATDGKVTFENYFSSSLMNSTEALSGIGSGLADLGEIIPTYFPSELPVSNWYANFGAATFDSVKQAQLAGSAASYLSAFSSDDLVDEFASHNVQVLASQAALPYDMLCNTPVGSVADLRGLRSRSSGALWTSGLEALGVTPVSTEFAEMYESLQRGVIDCVPMNGPVYVEHGLAEVAQDYVPARLPQLQANTYTVNADVWDSFPPELQQVFFEASALIPAEVARENMNGQAAFAELDDIEYHDADEINAVLEDHYAGVIDGMAATAPEGVSDPQAHVDEYLALLDHWRDRLQELGYVSEETGDLREDFLALADLDLDDYAEALREAAAEYAPER